MEYIKSLVKKFCINKLKKYIFIFDQYNYELDIAKELYSLNEFLKNQNNQYGIIACCSMNNKSIRELKIQNLFGEEKLNNFPDNIKIKELKNLFDVSQLNIDGGGIYDQIFEKLGKTIKNFIILTKYRDNNDYLGLKEYLEKEKYKICNNLKKFFNLNTKNEKNEKEEDLIRILSPILSFTVNTNYEKEYIKKIKNNIPFKYFDIQKIGKNLIQIVFNFPLVGEVMTEIYENIVYENKSMYSLFFNIGLDKGALGGLYEKYVIHFMEPDKNQVNKNLFNYFKINRIEIVDKFVPNNNENYSIKDKKIKSLKDGDYLFKQKQFNGKAFDCAILRIKNNEAKVFFFQISINKETVYEIKELINFISSFIDYFGYKYKLKISEKNVFFTYIFDTQYKEELFKKCQKNNLKCIFFCNSMKKFVDINNYMFEKIENVYEIFINPYILFNNLDIIMVDLTKRNNINNINSLTLSININQKKSIENFWKTNFKEFSNKNLNLNYSHFVE